MIFDIKTLYEDGRHDEAKKIKSRRIKKLGTISTWVPLHLLVPALMMPSTSSVSELIAYQIYDSRGQPTLETRISLLNGIC